MTRQVLNVVNVLDGYAVGKEKGNFVKTLCVPLW